MKHLQKFETYCPLCKREEETGDEVRSEIKWLNTPIKERIEKRRGWSWNVVVGGTLRFQYYYDYASSKAILLDLKNNKETEIHTGAMAEAQRMVGGTIKKENKK